MLTIDEKITRLENFAKLCEQNGMHEWNEEHEQLAAWLRELKERRKQPKIICCGECGHSMYDEDGELYCDNPNTDIYYTRYDFACNR